MLKSFYPKFPFIHPKDPYLDPYENQSFNDVIASKKEFVDLKLEEREEFPEKPGDLLNHQKYIARFLSSTTGYDELLLFHEPGTGKTCSAVAVIENLRADKQSMMKGAVICAKGDGLLKNFVQELVFTCTDGRYIPEDYDNLTKLQQTHRLRKITSEFYSFHTFEIFAKTLRDMSDAQILNEFEDHIFVVDEVHNLRQHDEEEDPDKDPEVEENQSVKSVQSLNVYFQFERLFRTLTRRKILLMSGTPIKDVPEEFASVMNLILPQEWKFKTGKDFVKKYFDSNGMLKESAKPDMIERIRGRISYLNSATSQVKKLLVGKPIGNLKHFRVAADIMNAFQSRAYEKAYISDEKDKSIFIGSRQASLFVFPDGSFGKNGFDKFITRKTKKSLLGKSSIHYEASTDLIEATNSLEKIATLSSKYASVLNVILSSGKSKHFVYCQYVNGSGAIVFGKLLERFGYVQATGLETSKAKRYVLISRQTASTTAIQKLINAFNYDKNVDGEYISVLIGSRVMNEGFTLKNVRNEFILTCHWNYAEIAQAIARGWRVGSHNELLERGDTNVNVSVYQCVSLPLPSSSVPSIDLEMYRVAEEKDVVNRQIERLVKENAFDCPLTLARNKVFGYDGQRECDYVKCDYDCDGTSSYPLDTSTFDLMKTDLCKKIESFLSRSFRYTDFVSISNLKSSFQSSDNFEISMAMKRLIESNAVIADRLGYPKFIRFINDEIFLSDDPQSKNQNLSRFYSVHSILSSEKSFDEILTKRYEEALPMKIEELFAYPEKTRELLIKLSKEIQREILQFCLIAKDRKLTKNASIRNDILSFYHGFYDERPINGRKTWVVSLYADSLGHSCFDATAQKFIGCDVEQLPQKRAALKDVEKIGYFGLFNPALNDFCLRLVTEAERSETDLRKLAVGRRCVNFESGILIDIAARRMFLDAPADFLKNESFALLSQRLKKSKYAKDQDFVDSDTVKRVLFWTTRTKDQICKEMKRWFEDRNLLETNFNCGSQAKKRLKAL